MQIDEILRKVRSADRLLIRSRSFIRLHPSDLSGLVDLRNGQELEIAVGRTKDQEADQVAAMIYNGAIDFADSPIHPAPKAPAKKGGSKSGKKGGSKSGKKGSPEGGESDSAAESSEGAAEQSDTGFDPSNPERGEGGA